MKPFSVSETYQEGIFMIGFDNEKFFGGEASGSYHIIGARILGLTYANYLRYLRDKFDAELRGREGYSYPVFKSKESCKRAVNHLNDIWGTIERTLEDKLCDTGIKTQMPSYAIEVVGDKVRTVRKIRYR